MIPDRRFSYALVSGLPLPDYRADVDLEPDGAGGTVISWSGSWRSRIPGTGVLITRLDRQFSAGLVAKAEQITQLR